MRFIWEAVRCNKYLTLSFTYSCKKYAKVGIKYERKKYKHIKYKRINSACLRMMWIGGAIRCQHMFGLKFYLEL